MILLLIGSISGADLPPIIDLYYIKFNYTSGTTNDAIDIRINNSTDISVPEWYPSYSRNEKIAYKKSQSNRKIKAKFYVYNGPINNMKVYANHSGGWGNINEGTVTFNGSAYSSEALLTFSGTTPSSVGKRYLALIWYITEIDGEPIADTYIHDSGFHAYYTLLDDPVSPMQEPWTQVLDYTCSWASGQTTNSGTIKKITEGAYNNIGKTYYGGDSHTYAQNFYLTNFFSENYADCQDMSAVVQTFSNAVGISNVKVRRVLGPFYTQYILPIGTSNWLYSIEWGIHQFSYYNNKVYDAVLKLWDPIRIPTAEGIYNNYYYDLFLSGTWNLLTPTAYTNVY